MGKNCDEKQTQAESSLETWWFCWKGMSWWLDQPHHHNKERLLGFVHQSIFEKGQRTSTLTDHTASFQSNDLFPGWKLLKATKKFTCVY